jgi:hypothetical protein
LTGPRRSCAGVLGQFGVFSVSRLVKQVVHWSLSNLIGGIPGASRRASAVEDSDLVGRAPAETRAKSRVGARAAGRDTGTPERTTLGLPPVSSESLGEWLEAKAGVERVGLVSVLV